MKKIAVFNVLNINNFGDQFIADCVKYLIDQEDGYSADIFSLEPHLNFIKKFFYLSLLFIAKFFRGKPIGDKLVYLATILRCRNYYKQSLASYDAVVIGGGSFKYGTQKVWAEYSVLIDVSESLALPVMFNAVNIQQFDKKSWKCKCLAIHASKPNVRMITSRDGSFGANRLRKEYKIPDHIICEGVGDPAFWIPECYQISQTEHENIVGINIINGKNFQVYGGTLSEDEIATFYGELLRQLDKKNIKWELFTNGLNKDLLFGNKILKKYGNMNIKIYVPFSAENNVEKIASYKVMLGGRLHACICAYSLDIPFCGLNWDEKILHFSEISNTEGLFFNENNLKADVISNVIETLFKQGYCFDSYNRDIWKEKTKAFLNKFLLSI